MVPLLAVGVAPPRVALWLYALHPIAQRTYSSVRHADPDAVETAKALGATPARLGGHRRGWTGCWRWWNDG